MTRDRKGNWRKEPRTDETSLEIWKTGRKIIREGEFGEWGREMV